MDDGSYYTPISPDGQVVRKRIDSIEIERDADPRISVSYSIANPYDHPVVVGIHSGLTVLYQTNGPGEKSQEGGRQELRVLPAAVSESGHLLYASDEAGAAFGTTSSQRNHLGSGVPNYRHPLTVTRTLVPGDTLDLEATAKVPRHVSRLILVDAMVGANRPYGVYPQQSADAGIEAPALRIFDGASFEEDPPTVHIVMPKEPERPHRILRPETFERLRGLIGTRGGAISAAVTATVLVLAASMVVRLLFFGLYSVLPLYVAELVTFSLLGYGTIRKLRVARWAFVLALALGSLEALTDLAIALVHGDIGASALLTEFTIIPTIYLIGAFVMEFARPVREHASVAVRRKVNRKER